MPNFQKKSLTAFLRNKCERQFILSLYSKEELEENCSLPTLPNERSDLALTAQAGYDYQVQKVNELKELFGEAKIIAGPLSPKNRPTAIDLLQNLSLATENQFIVEGKYDVDNPILRSEFATLELKDMFRKEVGFRNAQPDIIQIFPSMNSLSSTKSLLQTKEVDLNNELGYYSEVLPNGLTRKLGNDDIRLRLRVIDVKLNSDPSSYYFAEVVYYSITLSAWLKHNNLDQKFVVIAAPAILAGSYEASQIRRKMSEWSSHAHTPTIEEKINAFNADLEVSFFEIFSQKVKKIFNETLPELLNKPWNELSWFVNYRCKGCEFLGVTWKKDAVVDELLCYPTATKENHLSQVFGLSRGCAKFLSNSNISKTNELAVTDLSKNEFSDHQSLRAKKTIFPSRAKSIINNLIEIIPNSGGDAQMPEYPDLHIYIFLEFDLSKAITAAIGISAFWIEPLPYKSPLTKNKKRFIRDRKAALKIINSVDDNEQNEEKTQEYSEVFLIDRIDDNLERERLEFIKFLKHLKGILNWVVAKDTEDTTNNRRDSKTKKSSYQIYLWDESQRKHLVRLVGRHLAFILNDPELKDFAWLFPPPELLPKAENATRQSPVTIISSVVNNTIAVPLRHHYSLITLVNKYKSADKKEIIFYRFYHEPMSDLIPAERIYEWWGREENWSKTQQAIEGTTRKKTYALELIIRKLEQDLRGKLFRSSAPLVDVKPSSLPRQIAIISRLWLEFGKLNNSLESLEVHLNRSMPPHEREAKGKAARLKKRLVGEEKKQALAFLNKTCEQKLTDDSTLFIYKMSAESFEFNARPNDFLLALSPESDPLFLDHHPFKYVEGTSLDKYAKRKDQTFETLGLTQVSIEAIDRDNGFIALRAARDCQILQLEKESKEPLDFSKDVLLDFIHKDYLLSKIEPTLLSIYNPPSATSKPNVLKSLGLPANYKQGKTNETTASQFLWQTPALASELTNVDTKKIRVKIESFLKHQQNNLNLSQWNAWEEALSKRFSIIWGPPGTGKSRTLQAIVLGIIQDAVLNQKPLRLLITANTNTALDNVILKVERELSKMYDTLPLEIYRVFGSYQSVPEYINKKHPNLIPIKIENKPSNELRNLLKVLNKPQKISIVGCLPQQLHNLSKNTIRNFKDLKIGQIEKIILQEWFDFVVLDEASQIEISTTSLVFSKISSQGGCVIAGDDKQLAPIQKAEPPLNLENLVGSAYNYFRHYQEIEPNALDINYRSNKTIVELTKKAGYSSVLESNSPNLSLSYISDIPIIKPHNFPNELVWSENFAKILDPVNPVVCFVYDDEMSSQLNNFEADTVSSLIWLIKNYLSDKLLYEKGFDGVENATPSDKLYQPKEFWEKGIGVVTPHRAQMAKIIGRLQNIFPNDSKQEIRNAVDTVDRFQGQERDVIIASFGIGDEDLITSEEEFLFNFNRFNVLSSRARAKFIVLITKSLLEHFPNDVKILEKSRFLKSFGDNFCHQMEKIQLAYKDKGKETPRNGELRYRSAIK